MSPNVLALLPEIILTLTGVLVMLAEPCSHPPPAASPLAGSPSQAPSRLSSASWWQISLGTIHAFSNTIQVDAFSILFHFVIGAVVLVTLLGSLDYFQGNATHAGEVLRPALLRRRRHDAHDLLGRAPHGLHRPRDLLHLHLHHVRLPQGPGQPAPSPPSSTSSSAPSPPPSSSTVSPWPSGPPAPPTSTPSAHGLQTTSTPALAFTRPRPHPHRPRLQGLRRSLPRLTPDVYQGAPRSCRRPHVHMPPRLPPSPVLLRVTFTGFPPMQHRWAHPHVDSSRPLHDHRQPRRSPSITRTSSACSPTPASPHRRLSPCRLHAFPYLGIAAACFIQPPPTPP